MNEAAAIAWLTWLYGETFEGHLWVGGHADGFGGRLFDRPEDAAEYAMRLDAMGGMGVYHRLTTMRIPAVNPETGRSEGRGKVIDSISLPALAMDLDIRGPGHVDERYPETEEQLRDLLTEAGLPEPSAWIDSGGGRYAVWKLDKPSMVGNPADMAEAQNASRRLHRGVIDLAKTHGWKIDNTSDLARIFRVPGTTNRKAGQEHTATVLGTLNGRVWPMGDVRVQSRPGAKEQVNGASATIGHDRPLGVADGVADDGAWFGGLAGLFGQAPASNPSVGRGFTLTEAMAFVAPALEALRTARDGEINVRLNEAACVLAHFGPEFWDEGAADRQLESALAATAYDGVTWKAADTIASARRAMSGDWRAVFVPAAMTALEMGEAVAAAVAHEPDVVDALLAEMVSLDQLESAPPPKFLVHRFLQFDSESWIIGQPGSKKSFVVFDIAARVVRGEPWQGFRTNPADVVFIVAEGASGHGKRVKAWRKRYGAVERDGRQAVFTLPRPVQVKDVARWAVLAAACQRLADRARDAGRGLLVVIDTQARVTVGLSENDNGEMNNYVEAVSAIRRVTGACVLTIHHTGKDGRTARGGSVIDGAQTTELKIVSDSGRPTARLLTEKQKDIDEHDPVDIAFEVIDVGQDDDGEALTSLVLAERDSAAFRAAWSGSEVTGEGIEAEAAARENPFKQRATIDPWLKHHAPKATMQQWIVQALIDTTETLGLTESGVKEIVAEKIGKPEASNWRRAWQKVTAESGPWADLVVNVGGQRWAIDRVSLESDKQG